MRYVMLLLATLTTISWSTLAISEEPEAEIRSSLSKDGKSTPCLNACTINFRRELQVPFDYLDSLGAQIHEARKLPDPVALAAAAKSLAIAEAVSGKSAKVTSQVVMDEAVKLAKLRGKPMELQAIGMLVADETTRGELNQMAEAASDQLGEVGESSKELIGNLVVENHTYHTLDIHMDGNHLGEVPIGQSRSFHVHNHNWHNHFDAYCADDGELIQHANYAGHSHHLRWHIDE